MRNGVLAGLVLGALLGAAPAASADAAPLPPTEIAQEVSLPQAAQARIVALNSKGGFGGDRMRVDLTGARIPGAPVTVRLRMEF
ncbi:MAG TPA: hypothetical protein VK279_03675 [Solirubrobacteraceae bacterium]|nr:hypothetical protein [Solirubrobacteraceae bacterium]